MAEKSQLEVGQRVRFSRSHDGAVELVGRIVKIHEDSESVDIETEPDGRIAEVSTTETAHAANITPVGEVTAVDERQQESQEEPDSETGAESRPRRHRRAG